MVFHCQIESLLDREMSHELRLIYRAAPGSKHDPWRILAPLDEPVYGD
jgi:hypothetical protein